MEPPALDDNPTLWPPLQLPLSLTPPQSSTSQLSAEHTSPQGNPSSNGWRHIPGTDTTRETKSETRLSRRMWRDELHLWTVSTSPASWDSSLNNIVCDYRQKYQWVKPHETNNRITYTFSTKRIDTGHPPHSMAGKQKKRSPLFETDLEFDHVSRTALSKKTRAHLSTNINNKSRNANRTKKL